MKEKHVKVFTVLGLVAILALQSVWLWNTYTIIAKEVKEKSDTAFKNAVFMEMDYRMNHMKKSDPDTLRMIQAELSIELDTTNTINMLGISLGMEIQEELAVKYNSHPSLEKLDSIYSFILAAGDMKARVICCQTDSLGNIQLTSENAELPTWGVIKTQIVPVRLDKGKCLQAVLVNPYWVIFQRMGILLIATALIMIFVVYCILFQIRIIGRQNKIAKLREDFSYAMIHDMKTPLSSILMGTQILESGKLDAFPEKRTHYFRILKDEGEHLLSLTNKVLTLAKLENHQLKPEKTLFPVRQLLDDLTEKFSAKAEKKVTFLFDLHTEQVWGDEEFLKEAISNLIDNAIKYSGESVEVTLSAVLSADNILSLKVKDNGFGIPLKDQSHIFEKYERASAALRSRYGGASGFGLGLNYVLRVAEAHGGSVKVESIEGEYSEFTINIPYQENDR